MSPTKLSRECHQLQLVGQSVDVVEDKGVSLEARALIMRFQKYQPLAFVRLFFLAHAVWFASACGPLSSCRLMDLETNKSARLSSIH